MRNVLVLAILISPLFLVAQEKGIVFEHGLSWQQVLEKAKAENKYVFVDCFTTWCGPCKMMDRDVYVDDSVGKFMNEKFICVKVQMDSTDKDTKETRSWYATVRQLQEQYSVHAYPSFLFFAPNGFIAYKYVGARDKKVFLGIANTGLNSDQKEYALAYDKYKEGKLDYRQMPEVSKAALNIGLDSVAAQIAKDYITNYLPTLNSDQVWTKDNLRFIKSYAGVLHTSDKIFQLYFLDRKKIDSVMGAPGYSKKVINSVVFKNELEPQIQLAIANHNEPQWRSLTKNLEGKYGKEYTGRNILNAQVEFYQGAKEWHKYVKYFIKQCEQDGIENYKSGIMGALILNNNAYEVFTYADNKKELKKALFWVDRSISIDPGVNGHTLDTKANILYRLGRAKEGMLLEEKSISLLPNDKEIHENLAKMKSGQPTWVTM